MAVRVDEASLHVPARPSQVFRAFAAADAMQRWLPPAGMAARVRDFDFRAGGGYRMRLTYVAGQGAGKTSADADEVEVTFRAIVPGERIEQDVRFASADAAFAGIMRMSWELSGTPEGTLVRVRATDVPAGIGPADHVAALRSTLANLAAFVLRAPGTLSSARRGRRT